MKACPDRLRRLQKAPSSSMRHNYRQRELSEHSTAYAERTMRLPFFSVLAFVFVCVALFVRPAQADPDAAGVITVTAKLVEIPSKPPPDELYDYAFVMRYEVIGGPLDKQSILVAHYK